MVSVNTLTKPTKLQKRRSIGVLPTQKNQIEKENNNMTWITVKGVACHLLTSQLHVNLDCYFCFTRNELYNVLEKSPKI